MEHEHQSENPVQGSAEWESLLHQAAKIIGCLPVGVGIYELREGELYPVFVSDQVCRLFGVEPEAYAEYIRSGSPILTMECLRDACEEYMAAQVKPDIVKLEFETKREDGTSLWLRIRVRRIEGTNPPLFCAAISDVTEEKYIQRQEQWQNERYRILNELTHAISYDYDSESDTMRYYIDADQNGVEERVLPRYLEGVLNTEKSVIHPDSIAYGDSFRLAKEGQVRGCTEYQADYYNTGYRWYRTEWYRVTPKHQGPWHLVGLVEDIENERSLRQKAEYDGVTGLINRATAEELIQQALEDSDLRSQYVCAVMDIDNFKGVNDCYGHLQGDELLREFGNLLRDYSRSSDIVGRIGGDEFVILYKDITLDSAIRKLTRLEEHVRNLSPFHFSVSIGVAAVGAEDKTYQDIVGKADQALYQAKRNGKGHIEVYRSGDSGRGF